MKFRLALRAISDLRKAEKRKDEAKTSEHYENQYHKNKWRFAKKAVNGDLDSVDEPPAFTKAEAAYRAREKSKQGSKLYSTNSRSVDDKDDGDIAEVNRYLQKADHSTAD